MKTKFILSALATCLFFFTSCSNDDSDENTNNPNPTTDGFVWTENGGNVEKTATDAQFSTQYKTFMVKDASGNLVFEINLTGTTPATYAFDTGSAFTYTAVNPYFIGNLGSLIITSNTSGKVSGTFRATGTGGGITAVSGSFTNVTVVP